MSEVARQRRPGDHPLVPLPDLSQLSKIDDAVLAKLRARLLEIDFNLKRLEPVVARAGGIHPVMRRVLLAYHLRKQTDPFAFVARALVFGDPAPKADLERVFGELFGPLLDGGWLSEREGGVVSPFSLTAVGPFFVLSDDLAHGGDAVMGLGPTTVALLGAAQPERQIGSALDLGCGAGALALAFSSKADKVVATDINTRALALARFNLRLNKVTNVELREGSLFEPVQGERFDLVASQPPFIPEVSGGKAGTFMTGGSRGDHIALALFEGVSKHLSDVGRAVVLCEWGHGPILPAPAERLRRAVGESALDVLVFQLDPSSIDTHAVEYAAGLHPTLGPEFEAEVARRIDHCAEQGFDVMAPTICVLAPCVDRKPRFDVIPAGGLGRISPNSRRIERLMRARAVVSRMDSVLSAKARMVDGIVLREEQRGPGAHVESTLSAILPASAMSDPMSISPLLLRLGTAVHESRSVRAGIQAYKKQYDSEEEIEKLAAAVGNALLSGLLEIVDS